MKISSQVHNRCLLLSLEGRLDALGSKELEREVESGVSPETLCAVIDMAKVDYLSSTALRILLMLHRKLNQRGGTIALSNIQPYCRGVLDIAGFSETFSLFDTADEATAFCAQVIREKFYLDQWEGLQTVNLEGGNLRIMNLTNDPGKVEVSGTVKDVLSSSLTVADLRSKSFSEKEVSFGIGGLGEGVKDCFKILGDMISIGGITAWLPTDGNDTADFLVSARDKGGVTLQTALNISIAGPFNELMIFKSGEDGGTSIDTLCRGLFGLAKNRRPDYKGVVGLALRAQMASVFGSAIKRSPILDFAPGDHEMISHPSHIAEWFKIDSEPRHRNVTALICGVGADLTSDLESYDEELLNSVFYPHPTNVGGKSLLLHNHAVIFKALPVAERVVNLEKEIRGVVEKGEFLDMRRLLGHSAVTQAIIGVSYVQAFRPDPRARGNFSLDL